MNKTRTQRLKSSKTMNQVKKQSHLQLKNIEGANTNDWFMQKLKMDIIEFNTVKYELGIAFLNMVMPENHELYIKSFKSISTSATYWKWFRREWDFELQDYIKFLIKHEAFTCKDLFKEEMESFIHRSALEVSFYQYLKIFHNGRM